MALLTSFNNFNQIWNVMLKMSRFYLSRRVKCSEYMGFWDACMLVHIAYFCTHLHVSELVLLMWIHTSIIQLTRSWCCYPLYGIYTLCGMTYKTQYSLSRHTMSHWHIQLSCLWSTSRVMMCVVYIWRADKAPQSMLSLQRAMWFTNAVICTVMS